jgi:hypothetical protein
MRHEQCTVGRRVGHALTAEPRLFGELAWAQMPAASISRGVDVVRPHVDVVEEELGQATTVSVFVPSGDDAAAKRRPERMPATKDAAVDLSTQGTRSRKGAGRGSSRSPTSTRWVSASITLS